MKICTTAPDVAITVCGHPGTAVRHIPRFKTVAFIPSELQKTTNPRSFSSCFCQRSYMRTMPTEIALPHHKLTWIQGARPEIDAANPVIDEIMTAGEILWQTI